jgi:hypothetical protein
MATSKSFNGRLQSREAYRIWSQHRLALALLVAHHEPRNVAVGHVFDFGHFAKGIKEAAVYDYRHFLAPSPQRWYLDLQLRHEALRAAAPIIWPPSPHREWHGCCCAVPKSLEFSSHRVPREIHRLDFQGAPTQRLALRGVDKHVVNPSHIARARIRVFPKALSNVLFKESYLANNQGVGVS